jgi:hypothetical protein
MKRLMSALALLIAAAPAAAFSPELNQILPRGGQRGTDATLTFTGPRVGDARELVLYRPGISLVKIEPVDANSVRAVVRIAPDCPLGEHPVRLRGPGGTSTLRTFWVGALPSVDEKEPNNEFAKPQPIPLNCTVQGLIAAEDVDYFVVECAKGQRLSVEIEGMRLGTAFFDPAIAVLNDKRFEVAVADDSPRLGQDGQLSFIVPADGKYIIRVRESAYGGGPSSFYRLHVGTFPQPLVAVPAGGRPGEELDITFIGDPQGPVVKKVKLPTLPAGSTFAYHLEDAGGIAPAGVLLRLTDAANFVEVEPHDAVAQATPAAAPGSLNGVIARPGDHDFFKFSAKKGQVFDIRCIARKIGAPLDAVLWVSHLNGQTIAANDDGDGRLDAVLRFTAPEDKEYVIGVRDHLLKGNPLAAYRIEITAVEPRLTAGITRYGIPQTQERQTIDVPRGNRFAVLATVQRTDWSGDVRLSGENLPPGMSLVTDAVPAGLTVFPVVFEAKDDAPVGGTLGELKADPADPNAKVVRRFNQTVDLVFGQNNREYVTVQTSKVAFGISDPVPFSIRIVEPKAPLVRNGTMQLKVVAERRDGHKAAIGLQALFGPPGVAANAVAIPEGQNEAVLTLTANGGAGIGKWRYVVMGQSAASNGPAWVSSQLATIEVASPPLTVAFDRATVEQGKSVALKGRISVAAPFAGVAKLQLMGLPSKVTSDAVDATADTKEVTITVATDAASPAGTHKNLPLVASLTINGEPVTYTAGVAELRIDKPLAAKSPPPAEKKAAPPKDKAGKP